MFRRALRFALFLLVVNTTQQQETVVEIDVAGGQHVDILEKAINVPSPEFCDIRIKNRSGVNSDINGLYVFKGFHVGKPYYTDGTYFLFYEDNLQNWHVSRKLGSDNATVFARNDPDVPSPIECEEWFVFDGTTFRYDPYLRMDCGSEDDIIEELDEAADSLHPPNLWDEHFVRTDNVLSSLDLEQQLDETSYEFPLQKYTEPRYLTDPEHPAYDNGNGIGLFVLKDFPAGTLLGSYSGQLATNEPDKDNKYAIQVGIFLIDGMDYGNESRYINDAVNTGRPETIEFTLETSPRGQWIGLWVCRDIKSGEELLTNYGTGYRKDFFEMSEEAASVNTCGEYERIIPYE